MLLQSSSPVHQFFHQTKTLLTSKELLAYTTAPTTQLLTTPLLSSLAYSCHHWYHHHQVFCCSSNSITYLIQSCPLHTSQLHLYISLLQHALPRNCGQRLLTFAVRSGTHRAEDSLWAKSTIYLLIDFPTLKEILCSCNVGLRFC